MQHDHGHQHEHGGIGQRPGDLLADCDALLEPVGQECQRAGNVAAGFAGFEQREVHPVERRAGS